jgi:Sulfotransferase domain
VLSSRLSFTRRRGVRTFGLETLRDGEGDEDYVRGYMRHEVARFYDAWSLWEDESFLLRYESLLEEPEETIAAVFDYLGVDATPDTVASVLETARELDPETKRRHQTARDDRASIGRWREDLDERLQAAASEAFGEALTGLGYER